MNELGDIRVLDFGRFIAAPYCGMILADMGAQVIRIERSKGEEDRFTGRLALNGENLVFPCYARNKKGITLNLSRGIYSRNVLGDLVRNSDILLHNFSPEAAKIMGLNYENIYKIKPDIIYAQITAYGTSGPYANRNAFDPMVQTISGGAALTGFEYDPPMKFGVPWVDYSTALAAAVGILIALRHRERTGEGQIIDCALLRTAISFTTPMIAEAEILGCERPRIGNRLPYYGPSDMYKCKDGYVYIATIMEDMWKKLMKIVGHEEFLDDPDFSTHMKRFENRNRVDPLVAEWVKQHSIDEVIDIMEKERIPCAPFKSTKEVSKDPHVKESGMLEYVNFDYPGLEKVPVSTSPIKLSKIAMRAKYRPPHVGEHNNEIYGELLGYDEKKISKLRKAGII